MIYSLSSSVPEHYETINVNINIPWKCEQVKYYVSNVNTMSNFLITTEEDFLLIVMEGEEYNISFTNKTDYESSLIAEKNYLGAMKRLKQQSSKRTSRVILRLLWIKTFR